MAVLISFILFLSILINFVSIIQCSANEKLTIRVNTFRREDMLKKFLDYYTPCSCVEQIQVVWSDTKALAPQQWLKEYPTGKVIFEVHKNNSLSNRFRPLLPISTEAVFSVDDDIFLPCEELKFLFHSWKANRKALVGMSPRQTTHDFLTGDAKYMKWQHTWWNGAYSIILTKACMMNKDYLYIYDRDVPKSFIKYIDTHRNCEDIAMAYVVANSSQSPPVWTSVIYYDVATSGISSGNSHFDDRSHCIGLLESSTPRTWSWFMGLQKITPLSIWNSWGLFFDYK